MHSCYRTNRYSASSLESRIYIFYEWVMVTCEYLSNRMFSSIDYWYSYRWIILLNKNVKNVAMATLECGIRVCKNTSKSIVSDHLLKIVIDNP